MEYFEKIDIQFKNVEQVVENLIKSMNENSSDIFTTLRMLEFEKNKIKSELGSRNDVSINGTFDTASLWEVVESLSDFLNNLMQTLPGMTGI